MLRNLLYPRRHTQQRLNSVGKQFARKPSWLARFLPGRATPFVEWGITEKRGFPKRGPKRQQNKGLGNHVITLNQPFRAISMIEQLEKFFERLMDRSAPHPPIFDPLPQAKHYAGLHSLRVREVVRVKNRAVRLCPDLCLPPNPTKCYRMLGHR